MELDLLDRGVDILDFYRGEISWRRMHLLVVHDVARMPRTRAALSGTDPSRPWEEANGQFALLDSRLQALQALLWVGLRLKGKPPKVSPYPIPKAKRKREAPRMDPKVIDYLNRFSPKPAA